LPFSNGSYKLPVKIRRNYRLNYKLRRAKKQTTASWARAITHVVAVREHVYLLTVFDKSEKDNISDKELQELLKKIE
jgi:hypothetical protein